MAESAEASQNRAAQERFDEEVRANEAERQAEMRRKAQKQRIAEARRPREKPDPERALLADIERLRAEIPTAGADKAAKSKELADLVIKAEHTKAAADGRVDIQKLAAEAAGHLDKAIAARPSLELFDVMARLKPGPEVNAALVRACGHVRPQVDTAEIPNFVHLCLDRAGGDAKQLQWPSSAQDLATYKKAEEERAREDAQAP